MSIRLKFKNCILFPKNTFFEAADGLKKIATCLFRSLRESLFEIKLNFFSGAAGCTNRFNALITHFSQKNVFFSQWDVISSFFLPFKLCTYFFEILTDSNFDCGPEIIARRVTGADTETEFFHFNFSHLFSQP